MDSNDKVFGILSYIGILWIVGLAAGKTPFAKFHANQGLVLFLAEIVIGIAGGILSFIPFIGFIGGRDEAPARYRRYHHHQVIS